MIELIIPTTIFISGILLCMSNRTINRASNRKPNNYPADNYEVDNDQNIDNNFYFYDKDPPPYSED